MVNPSKYDRRALQQIKAWKNPEATWLSKVSAQLAKPVNAVGDFVLDSKLGVVAGEAVKGLITLLNEPRVRLFMIRGRVRRIGVALVRA